STQINAHVQASGDLTFNDPVTVGSDQSVTATNIKFASTLDDDGNAGTTSHLDLVVSGVATLQGAVGSIAALSSLQTGAAGSTIINGGSVVTVEHQTYANPVTLGAATALTGGGIVNL